MISRVSKQGLPFWEGEETGPKDGIPVYHPDEIEWIKKNKSILPEGFTEKLYEAKKRRAVGAVEFLHELESDKTSVRDDLGYADLHPSKKNYLARNAELARLKSQEIREMIEKAKIKSG